MKKQFVTYPIALKLKELGFNEQCMRYFNPKNDGILVLPQRITVMHNTVNSSVEEDGYCSAPLWQQVIDWFREEHNIDIIIKPWSGDKVGEKTYAADVFIFGTITYIKLKREGTYEEARDQAILKAIELCQNKK